MNKFVWVFIVFFAITIGLYPLLYMLVDMSGGFLQSKENAVLANGMWQAAFHIHIFAGGISLLTGWIQFNKRWRTKKLHLHRTLGKVYLIAVSCSGVAGGYLSIFATGGPVSSAGFATLAALWLTATAMAYRTIRKGNVARHQQWMTRSYALTFAAVTLRLWLPFLGGVMHMEFIDSYRLVAWLCWIPNLVIAEIIVYYQGRPRNHSANPLPG